MKKDTDPCGCLGPRSQGRALAPPTPLLDVTDIPESEPDPHWRESSDLLIAFWHSQAKPAPVTAPEEDTGEWPVVKPVEPKPPPGWDAIN